MIYTLLLKVSASRTLFTPQPIIVPGQAEGKRQEEKIEPAMRRERRSLVKPEEALWKKLVLAAATLQAMRADGNRNTQTSDASLTSAGMG
jgi:hypothetical protein